METETLFTTSKWDILNEIAQKPQAPLGIAKTLNMTIANVSQQLRLLEAAGLVKKQRVANVGAGQPRALFSLSDSFGYLSIIANGGATKELLMLSTTQIITTRSWLLENKSAGEIISKFAHAQDEWCEQLVELYFLQAGPTEIVLEAVTEKKNTSNAETFPITHKKKTVNVTVNYVSSASAGSALLFKKHDDTVDTRAFGRGIR